MAKSDISVFLRLVGQRKFNAEVKAAGAELETMGIKGAAGIARFSNQGEKLKSFGRSWTRNVTLPVTIGAGLAVKAAIDWESAFTGVRKTVNATEAQYASMERGIRKMSLHIPVAANDLAGIAEAAGQLGIKRKAILSFTRTIADLGVSTNLAGEEGASTLARFANITQMPQSQFRRLGSVIVALGNNGASTEKDIAAMGLRIAAAGSYVGMSEPQILGFANALSSVGIEAEAGGSAISVFFKTTNSAVAEGGKKLQAFAEVAGMSAARFKQAWERDAASASVAWIEGLARLKKEGEDVPKVLHDLSPSLRGIRIQDTLLRASGAGALLRESLELGARSWKENTALTEEASKRYKTVASQLQILKNKVIDAGVSLGQELIPQLVELVSFAGPKITALVHDFIALPGPVKAAALGFLVLTGPVASGLGYFANGLGRILLLTRGIANAGKAVKAEGLFGALGKSGAVRTAKDFAYSLGPALAAYGIGNIVTSALNKDWKDAGFEAGGAVAGGIAGGLLGSIVPGVGTAIGAMVGVGAGSLGGELLSGLFSSSPKIDRLKAQTQHLRKAMDEYTRSLHGVRAGERILARIQQRAQGASKKYRKAKHNETQALINFGAGSWQAHRAQLALSRAERRVTRAAKAEQNAHRLSGNRLKLYRLKSRQAVASIKQSIPTLRHRIKELNRENRAGKLSQQGLERLVKMEGRLRHAKTQLTAAYAKAESLGGKPWAHRLESLTSLQAEFGRKGHVLVQRMDEQREKMRQLKDMGLTQQLREEKTALGELIAKYEQVVELGNAAPPVANPNRRGRGAALGHRIPGGSRTSPKHRNTSGNAQAGASRANILFAAPKRLSLDGDRVIELNNHMHVTVLSELDGKRVAESTARQSQRAANRG